MKRLFILQLFIFFASIYSNAQKPNFVSHVSIFCNADSIILQCKADTISRNIWVTITNRCQTALLLDSLTFDLVKATDGLRIMISNRKPEYSDDGGAFTPVSKKAVLQSEETFSIMLHSDANFNELSCDILLCFLGKPYILKDTRSKEPYYNVTRIRSLYIDNFTN